MTRRIRADAGRRAPDPPALPFGERRPTTYMARPHGKRPAIVVALESWADNNAERLFAFRVWSVLLAALCIALFFAAQIVAS